MKTNQTKSNPFEFSDTNKRYYTYDYYLKSTFGGKVAKIPLDCGFTCPNIDGSRGVGGCIYCSKRGSGDFAPSPTLSITDQFNIAKNNIGKKWNTQMYIPYFQAHTNTYADIKLLRKLYYEALEQNGVVGINIATRADCLPNEVISLLVELSELTHLTVELGLQSTHNTTGKIINRCHTYEDFMHGYNKLRDASDKIKICIHLIEGLPGEDYNMMLESGKKIAQIHPDQVKIHSLNVLRDTALADIYNRGAYTPITKEDYIKIVCDTLEILPKDIVIGRLTGDGAASYLIAPLWTKLKNDVLNSIDKEMYKRGSYQGIYSI